MTRYQLWPAARRTGRLPKSAVYEYLPASVPSAYTMPKR